MFIGVILSKLAYFAGFGDCIKGGSIVIILPFLVELEKLFSLITVLLLDFDYCFRNSSKYFFLSSFRDPVGVISSIIVDSSLKSV